MCKHNSVLLCTIHLLQILLFVLFAIWMINLNNEKNDYESQCSTSTDLNRFNIDNTYDSNCPDYDWQSNKGCECVDINSTCEIAYNITNCISPDYSCYCQTSLNLPIIIEVMGYTMLVVIIFFELIKILTLWRVCCILSDMKNNPNGIHDKSCVKCGIATLGNSCLLQLLMCSNPGKYIVMYMFHRGMLFKGCGCCCIFFWQTLIGNAFLFFYGYVLMIGLFTNIIFASPTLWYMTLIINCVWILLQMVYCVRPHNTNDESIKLEVAKYNLPFAKDIKPSAGYTGIQTNPVVQSQIPQMMQQQVPLHVIQPQTVQPVQPVQPQVVYLQQTMPNGQVVYVQQQQQQQQPQTVVVVPQPKPPMTLVASTSIGATSDINVPGGGGNDYQVINASAPPSMNPEYEAPPPAYNCVGDDNGGEGGHIG
eukprot:546231_1